MVRIARQQMKIEDGKCDRGLLLRIYEDPPHAAFDHRRDDAVQARIVIEQFPQRGTVAAVQLYQHVISVDVFSGE